MLTDSAESELLHEEKSSLGPKLIAGLLALVFTAAVLAGYLYFRNRHVQQALVASQPKPTVTNVPQGPAKAHILVDEAMLKGGQTLIGGTVKNISQESLSGLAVDLELKRRGGGRTVERMKVELTPASLEPNEEARYAVKLPAQDFSAVRLVGLTSEPNATQLAYTTAQGQKRPPERLEPKVVVVPRRSSRGGEFLNSPDNPARVP